MLREAARFRLRTAAELAQLHEDLLFIVAFPSSLAARRQARSMLRAIAQRVRALPRAHRARLDDSGVAGSVTRHVFPFPIARLLAHGERAAIEWRDVEDESSLDGVVRPLLAPAAQEAFDSGEFGTREFVELARPADAASELAWLTSRPATADAWDDAEVTVAWHLGDSRRSVTHNALPGIAPVVRERMRRPDKDIVAAVATPLEKIELLPRREASRVIECARAALAARCREVNAMTYPNPDEVWWCDLGDGAALAVIGIAPAHRLTLETNTGYLLLSNGMPIGYGGVTPLFRQANTGINIFDPYRGSEAAYLWTQMLRAFHTLYGSRRFVVNPYQFGAGNAEAIQSGAFWFYYRLGFRPADAQVAKQAAREAARLAADRKHRSDARTLRALASCDLYLDLPGYDPRDFFDESLIARAGARAARQLASDPRAVEASARDLGAAHLADWTRDEQRGFRMLAPIFAGLTWRGEEDRAALLAMLRAKMLPHERTFALRSQKAQGAFRALARDLAAS
ncbi:MAG: hypothetical protein U1F54_22950 [Burkholderiales bacterium]